jgi:hypothetical protein
LGKGESGGIPVVMLIVMFVPIIVALIALMLIIVIASVLIAPSTGKGTNATGGDSTQVVTNADGTGSSTDNLPLDIKEVDAGGAGLVCVHLPGVSYPKTAALDRRVARRFTPVMNTLNSEGIYLKFNYGFRSTCQQVNVKAGGNLKAIPGTSPHEAGRAVDVDGMRWNPKRGRIVQIFREHGWRWLGSKDPPHFEVYAEAVGEASRQAMIRKNQADFKRGNPKPCRGRDC